MEAWTNGPNPQDPTGFARVQIKAKHGEEKRLNIYDQKLSFKPYSR